MPTSIKFKNFNACIVINSLVSFVIAYYFVVFSVNLFSILLAKSLGFDAELFFYGFILSGENWTDDKVIVVFLLGNSFSLLLALIFKHLYKKQRRYLKKQKIFFLWVYIIALTWFLGNVIIGAIFNFGIGAAFKTLGIPFLIKALLGLAAIILLLFLGNKAQRHVMISANLYYPILPGRNVSNYFKHQIAIPAFLGILIVILFKIPYLGHFKYLDLYILLPLVFFIAGLYFRVGGLATISFKSRRSTGAKLKDIQCGLAYIPFIILFLILIIIRIGLRDGLTI